MVHRPFERWNGVSQALAAGSFAGDDDVLSIPDGFDSLDLVGIELIDSTHRERVGEARFEREVAERRIPARNVPIVAKLIVVVRTGGEPVDDIVHATTWDAPRLTIVVPVWSRCDLVDRREHSSEVVSYVREMFRPIEYLEWISGRRERADFDLGSSDLRAGRPSLSSNYPEWDDSLATLENFLASEYGVERENVLITAGATHANFLAMAASIGSEGNSDVLVEKPAYEPLVATPESLGGRVHRFSRPAEDGFRLQPDRIEAAVGDDTSLIILTNRHNPSGTLADRETLERAAAVATDGNAMLLVDEVYAPYVHTPMGGPFGGITAAGLDNTVVTGSMTKFFGLGSIRVGWLVGPASFVDRVRSSGWHIPVLAEPSVDLAASVFQDADTWSQRSRSVVTDNHDQLATFVDDNATLDGFVASGSTYALLEHSHVDGNAIVDAAWERGILLVPGRFFDEPDRFRVSLGYSPAENHDSLAALGNVLKSL